MLIVFTKLFSKVEPSESERAKIVFSGIAQQTIAIVQARADNAVSDRDRRLVASLVRNGRICVSARLTDATSVM